MSKWSLLESIVDYVCRVVELCSVKDSHYANVVVQEATRMNTGGKIKLLFVYRLRNVLLRGCAERRSSSLLVVDRVWDGGRGCREAGGKGSGRELTRGRERRVHDETP